MNADERRERHEDKDWGWVDFSLHTSHFTLLKWQYKQILYLKPISSRKRD